MTENNTSPAFEAIKNNNLQVLQSLNLSHILKNCTQEKSLLYYACEFNSVPIVKYLLSFDLDPNYGLKKPEGSKESPLYKACSEGFYDIVELLVLDTRVTPSIGFSCSNTAITVTNISITPLMAACKHNHHKIVQLLLMSTRVDVNVGEATIVSRNNSYLVQDNLNEKISPFYKASPEVAKLLIDHPNFDVNSFCYDSSTTDNHKVTTVVTPLVHACSNSNIEIVKLLLNKPNIDINKQCGSNRDSSFFQKDFETPLSKACNSGNLELIELLLENNATPDQKAYSEALNKNIKLDSMVTTFAKRFGMKRFIIKKCERDRIHEKLVCFVPLLSKVASSLFEIVINNESFIEKLTIKQTEIVQQLIDNILYDKNIETENNIEYHLNILFILEKVYGDYTQLRAHSLKFVISSISFQTVLDILEIIEKHIAILGELNIICTNGSDLLPKLKEYCLDFIGSKATDPNYETYVEGDGRVDKYLKTLLKRRNLNKIDFNNEPSNKIPPSALTELLNDGTGFDIEIQVGEAIVKCHKTILETKSKFFETIFNGNWDTIQDQYPPETLYIIQYCYGKIPLIPPIHLIPLVKKAHEHEIHELVTIAERQLAVTSENFFELVSVMEYYKEFPIFFTLIEKIVTFGAINASSLFNSSNITHFSATFKDQIFLRISSRRH